MAKKAGAAGKGFSGGGGGGNGFAQSGGKNSTFGGGKGGTRETKQVTQGKKIGKGTLNNGLKYNVRTEGGSATLLPETFRVGAPPPVHPGGDHATKTRKVTIKKPQTRGGSH